MVVWKTRYMEHTWSNMCTVYGMRQRRRKILLPSAVHLEERLTVSQAVPEPGKQSVRSNTQFGFFCQWQTRAQTVGTPLARQRRSGRMVMQQAKEFLVGGSNPGRPDPPPPPPPPRSKTLATWHSNRRPLLLRFAALPFDQLWCDSHLLPHCLEPSQQKLSNPPNPPQKSVIQF